MQSITKVVSEWSESRFGDRELTISEDEERASRKFTCEGDGDFEYTGFVEVYGKQSQVVVFLYFSLKVPPKYRDAVARLLVMANHKLNSGWIGMDMEDGELRYKSSVSVADGTLTSAMVSAMVDSGISVLDRYLPAVTDVIFSGATPESAFSKVGASETAPILKAEPVGQSEARPWESFTGAEAVRGWAADICRARSATDDGELWKIAGRGVVLVNEDRHYCREVLRRVAADCEMAFVSIRSEDVMDMPPFTSLKRKPALVYLEPGNWMLEKPSEDRGKSVEDVRAFQSRLGEWLDNIEPDHHVVCVMSADELRDVAVRLRRVGAFDRFIGLMEEPVERVGNGFLDKVGRERCSQGLLGAAAKIGSLVRMEMSEGDQRELAVLCLQRMHGHVQRELTFLDLVQVVTRTLQEEKNRGPDNDERRKQTAVHEAGHAIAALLDSDGKNVPEYASIIPSTLFRGIVVESLSFHQSRVDFNTYQDFRHDIRICLAGRAAEELIYGPCGITTGSSGDLEQATRHAHRAFATWGFVPQMETTEKTGSNLAVIIGKPSSSEWLHIEGLVRTFLEREYAEIKAVLSGHRDMLMTVAERLLVEPVLSQEELSEIYRSGLKSCHSH